MLKPELSIAMLAVAFPAFAFTNIPANTAVVRALNKQTGRTKDIEIPVGTEQIFENVSIAMKSCFTRPEDEVPENTAFMQIFETGANFKEEMGTAKKGASVFSGWMYSSSPSLNAMEHPNYDIWLLECRDDPRRPKIAMPEPAAPAE
ncbi:MAG: DUF2155 domain-containing protein [Rickettsiales bacterium]|jgi:hypothetical protein|nr:DUF2155 domain-containing protein [Rickettsiales bacterium]